MFDQSEEAARIAESNQPTLSFPVGMRPGPLPSFKVSEVTPEITPPELGLMLQAAVTVGERTDEGNIIQLLSPAWRQLAKAIVRDRQSLFRLGPRESEELIAGGYKAEGYEVVILTPRSGDFGRDIIATRQDLGSIRIIDQVKRYGPGRRVPADDVRALLGVLLADPKATKGIVTTTSEFAPGIYDDPIIKPYMPYRLELRSGTELIEWLRKGLEGDR
jgi:restriction system protein